MYELRYLIRNGWDGPEQVLQYRTEIEVTDYCTPNPITGDYTKKKKWTEWGEVPTVDETK
jgi:hypothetical protein